MPDIEPATAVATAETADDSSNLKSQTIDSNKSAAGLTESATLNNGVKMPLLGLGTLQTSKAGDVEEAVKHALKVGYRHIDGAAFYANEKEIGKAVREAMADIGIKREELFITSKLWNTRHHPEDVEPACRQTLEDLGLDYLDMYLIHWPQAWKSTKCEPDVSVNATETWLAMEKLVEKGLTKSIGVSNFNAAQIKDILDKGKIVPATNQVESHPHFNQDKLIKFCKEHGIVVTAHSPLGCPGKPRPNQNEHISPLDDPLLIDMAKTYNKSVAQLVIRWQVQRGIVVIPKSVTPSRIEANTKVFDFRLSEEDMKTLGSLDKGQEGRQVLSRVDKKHPHYPFNDEF